jgi:ABC-type phosphate transport system substrate-binding protein
MNVENGLKFTIERGALLLSVALTIGASAGVRADDCGSLSNPVYVAGSSASKLFVASVAAQLRQQSPAITVVYQSQGSCAGVNYFATDTTGTHTGTGVIFDNDGKDIPGGCALTGNTVDIGVSDVYAASCGVDNLPSNVKDFFGPVQSMTFVVPTASSQSIISAEAAYLVYGFGNDSEVSPWTDETKIEQRSATSGTQQMIAAYIKVPAAKFKGHANGASGDVVTSLAASATAGNADKAIGILATDAADKNRAALKILGYQHYGQSCAYWPDSSVTSFDKANVRDGHYPIWGPLHMLARTVNGEVANANVKLLLDYLSGAKAPSGFDLIKVEAKNGVVPGCAMHVARTKDGGELMSFMPDESCECKFIKEATGVAPDSCMSCDDASTCPKSAPACNYNFCEVK